MSAGIVCPPNAASRFSTVDPLMQSLSAIILAAGKGTRMRSDLPKVAHEVCGQAMVNWVAKACAEAGCSRIVVVVGYQRDVVKAKLAGFAQPGVTIEYAIQDEQLGTGHAVRCAESLFAKPQGDVFVLAGDGPLIRGETLKLLLDRHRSTGAMATMATSVIADPSGYGRITRDSAGRFAGIVEEKHCSPAQKAIREVNPSYYCFRTAELFKALERVKRNEGSGEYYITDVPSLMMQDGGRVEVIDAVPPEDVLSINTPEQLAEVDAVLRSRLGGRSPQTVGGAR